MEPGGTDPEGNDRQPRKARWSDLSPQARTAIVLGGILELIMTTVALADLKRRPAREVRGSKLVWVVSFAVQPFGPMLYLLVGRRPAP